ncbi:MAG: ATP-binding protein [Deltaproteobacteria bacterium]|nr:ATP-binding protein [Deltaproteobacteria bacterium]
MFLEFDNFIEAIEENQRIELKQPCNWDEKIFAKDILALSNVRDGGYILVGVEQLNNTFIRKGVTPERAQTFDIEKMRDQMEKFSDPCVNFRVDPRKDKEDRLYIIIYVLEFDEIPVICKRDSGDTKKGHIYYRNRTRRWESAIVSNSYDMKDIIERSAVKMMKKYRELGLKPESVETNYRSKYDEELEGLL